MSALEVPEVDEAVFTEDEEDYDDEEGGQYEESGDKRNQDYQEEESRKKAYGAHEEKWNETSQNGFDASNIQKDDLIEELKLFKAVCDNIKYTLAEIKSYSKVTLMSDSKASYFTIVDAVLSGPKEINPDDLMSILGVSINSKNMLKVCTFPFCF